jgi:hypothetical protein
MHGILRFADSEHPNSSDLIFRTAQNDKWRRPAQRVGETRLSNWADLTKKGRADLAQNDEKLCGFILFQGAAVFHARVNGFSMRRVSPELRSAGDEK